jgi:hypothetical protein
MAYLQLAEDNPYTRLAEDSTMGNYLFIPAGTLGMETDTYVRSDFFDSLPDNEFNATMTILAPYQNTGMNDGLVTDAVGAIPVFGGVAKFGANLIGKIAKNRKDKQQAGVPIKPIFKGKPGGLIDKIKGAVSKNKTKPDKTDELTKDFPIIELDGTIGGSQFNVGLNPTEEPTFFKKYKTPLLIGGGLLVAFGAYKLIKKKK